MIGSEGSRQSRVRSAEAMIDFPLIGYTITQAAGTGGASHQRRESSPIVLRRRDRAGSVVVVVDHLCIRRVTIAHKSPIAGRMAKFLIRTDSIEDIGRKVSSRICRDGYSCSSPLGG